MSKYELSKCEVIARLAAGVINAVDASKQLSLTARHIRRLKKRFREHGAKGLIHASRGKRSNRRINDSFMEKVKSVVMRKYHDFGPTFASEKLLEIDKIKISKETLRLRMSEWGIWRAKPKRKSQQYRSWRPRKEQFGEMEQFDGSYHDWFEEGKETCLLGSIDDATGALTRLEFAPDEGVKSVFSFWKEYIKERGKPVSIYLDRFSTYKDNHKNAVDNKELRTQFQRAAKELDIRLITAYSPQAKGRVERLFETLQDRLTKELRLRGIKGKDEANKFMKDAFIHEFNRKFAVNSEKEGDLHRMLSGKDKDGLDGIFSSQETRVVSNDFTIRYKNKWLQLEESQPTLVLPKERVLIEERLDDSLRIRLGSKYLNFRTMPERSAKTTPRIALTRKSTAHKPAEGHPWRKSYQLARSNYQTI